MRTLPDFTRQEIAKEGGSRSSANAELMLSVRLHSSGAKYADTPTNNPTLPLYICTDFGTAGREGEKKKEGT